MVIEKDEIDKYIFNPKNPKQCLSYGALLKVAKKADIKTFISPDYFKYFMAKEIYGHGFDDDIWNKPNNYDNLSFFKKLEIYREQNSDEDLKDFLKEIKVDFMRFKTKYQIFRFLFNIDLEKIKVFPVEKYHKNIILQKDIDFNARVKAYLSNMEQPYINSNFIFLSKNVLSVLHMKINKVSVMITGIENKDAFLQYTQTMIKPIFLKKVEDVDLLLNILENDLNRAKKKNLVAKTISRLDQISIKNFFSIKDIRLDNLKNKKEIYIVGENGDGKTLFLQSLVIALSGVREGDIFDLVKREKSSSLVIIDSEKAEYTKENDKYYNNILAYGASRNNFSQIKEDTIGCLSLFSNDYDLKSPTKWLQYLDYSEQKKNSNVISVVEVKKLLQHLLNSDIEIDISPERVTFKEKGSEVSFEQLSAGYKSVITIICDLIARLSEKQEVENIREFQGVVLIDEVELHLHPKWQYSFMKKIQETFPLIQFIVTTHSSTVLSGAGREAVYYRIYKEDGVVKISEQKEVKSDFLNSIETIKEQK